jgi:hypothetical protein
MKSSDWVKLRNPEAGAGHFATAMATQNRHFVLCLKAFRNVHVA